MRWHAKLRMLLRSLFERRQLDDELDEELREHIEREIENNIRAGMSQDEARRAAHLTVGPLTQIKDECREARAAGFIETLIRDLQFSLRTLLRNPAFTLIALITLAIGIGATSAIFSVVNGVLLKPLPYPHPDELITVNHFAPGVNLPKTGTAPFLHFTYHDQAHSFQDVGIYRWSNRTVTGLNEPEDALSLNVSAQVLPILGVQPALGRWFSDKEDTPGRPLTVVLSYAWWQARFGGDRSVLGRPVIVDGNTYEVIGVLPPNFTFLDRNAAFLLPLQLDRNRTILGNVSYEGIARLKPGVTVGQAIADLARLIPIALHSYPPQPGFTVKAFEDVRFAPRVEYLKQSLIGDLAKTLWVLMGTIGIVLLIACANVANLQLVRVDGRQHELAIRAALGARRRDIARELLMESIALGLLGGVLGLGIAEAAIRLLIAIGAGASAAPERDLDRSHRSSLHLLHRAHERSSVWHHSRLQVRRAAHRHPTAWRRTNVVSDSRTPPHARDARYRAGCVGGDPACRLRPDDPDIPGAASRRCGVQSLWRAYRANRHSGRAGA